MLDRIFGKYNNTPLEEEPVRDADLGRALAGAPAVVDRERLVAAIVATGRPRLARLEQGDAWWEVTAQWSRAAIPIGLAASLVVALVASRTMLPSDETTSVPARAPAVAFAAVASTSGIERQLADSLIGPATHDWLLAASEESQ